MLFLGNKTGHFYPNYWLSDSNRPMAIITSVYSFMWFKDLKIKYSPLINAVGSCTFGVLLIHANSGTMRRWLWQNLLNNVGYYSSDTMILHFIFSVTMVFIVCTVIDFLRQITIEKYVMAFIGRKKIIDNIRIIW